MVDKLRKALAWLWRIKERIILATMVVILCLRVYKVIQPDEIPDEALLAPPRDTPAIEGPGLPPPIPAVLPPIEIRSLINRNMFSHNPGGAGRTDEADAPDLRLLRVTAPTDRLPARAYIQTGPRARKWVSEGGKFETFELLSLDVEARTARVFDSTTNETYELKME